MFAQIKVVFKKLPMLNQPLLQSQVTGWYKVEPVEMRVLLPHEILHSLACAPSTAVFNSVFLGNQPESTRVQFWEHCRQLKPWKSHPMLSGASYRPEKLIGLCIHGDGCQMFKDEVFVWSISSMFAQEGTITDVLVYKFPFVTIPEKYMRSPTAFRLYQSIFLASYQIC